jgi:hypothetical protein
MKSLNEKMKTYSLPETTTSENLGCSWNTVVDFGNKVLLAGYFLQRSEGQRLLRGGLRTHHSG